MWGNKNRNFQSNAKPPTSVTFAGFEAVFIYLWNLLSYNGHYVKKCEKRIDSADDSIQCFSDTMRCGIHTMCLLCMKS